MTFMEDIALCIIEDSINEENINKIVKLISNGTNCMFDLIESLSGQLASTLAEERKKGINILRLVFKGLILKDTLSNDCIKLLSCFVVNYLLDWACIDDVLDILTCIIKTKSEVLRCTYLNILEDDKLFEEYSFNPIVSINTGIKGKVMNDGNSIKLCTKICTFHKFSNQYGIDNVDKQEDLYKMTLLFYIFTQIIYIVPTRQLVYTSRISVLNILIIFFENEEYITNIRRMGPAAIPAIIQHIQGEKDPRVLILSFRLIKNLLLKFEDIIKIYDNIEVDKDKSALLDTCSKHDYYKGLIPEIVFDNKNLEDCEYLEMNEIENNSSNILSTLISDVLLSYFPLNFHPPANDIHKISPKTLKKLLFEAITSTNLLQDAIIKTIIELMDTQNLVEDNIYINKFDVNFIYEEFCFDNYELENKKDSKLSPVILGIEDEEILQDIKDILTLYGINLIPNIITKYINELFLFIQQLLKRTIICNNNICSLLFYIIGTLFKYQSLDKDGDFILRNGIHKYIILDMINKLQNLDDSTELDPFSLNLINSCNLYYNMFILICIENEFLDYLIQNIMNVGKSRIITLRILSSLLYTHLINIYQSDNNILLEINKNPIFLKLCEFCKLSYLNESDDYILLIYCLCSLIIEYNNNTNTNNIMWFYDELKRKWDNINHLSKDNQSFIYAITCILFIQNEDISRDFWLEYIKNKSIQSIQSNYNLIILRFIIYSFYKSQNPPISIIKSVTNDIEEIILCDISESNNNEQIKYCLIFLKMIWNILNIYKCKNIILNISINIDNWLEHIFYHIFPTLINNKLIEKYQYDMNNSYKYIKSINLNDNFDYRKYIWIIGNLISSLKFINLSTSDLIIKIIDYINHFKNILNDNELFFIYRIFLFILLNGITDNNYLFNLLDKNIEIDHSIVNILEYCYNWLNDLENIGSEIKDFKCIYKSELEHLIINLIQFYFKYNSNDINKIQVIFQYKWNSKIIGISIRLIELNTYINKQNIKDEDEQNLQFKYILDYTDQVCKLATSNNINELYLISCLLYIIGGNLPIIIKKDLTKSYLQIGNYYLNFNNINNEDYIRKFQNISDIFIYYKNLGDCIIEDIQLNFYNFMDKLDHIYDNINNLIIPTSNNNDKDTIMDKIDILNNKEVDIDLENIWPLNINLTDLCSQININQTIIKSYYIKISDIIISKIIQTILYNDYKVNSLILIPIMAIFSNVSISLILKYNNENILRYIFMLSLLECSGLNTNNPNENSKLKILLIDYTSKKFENDLDNNFDNDEIIKLLDWQENKNCFSDIKFEESSDYFIYNLQTLSILIRFIYFVHKRNISFNSNINQDYSNNLDFICNDLFIYGLLASHIIIYHPLPLVRLFSYLLIKQIFKFPGIFRIGIKNKILSALSYLINNEKNKFLRNSASILHCQLIIMEDSL
ncbi:uncharacterized protein CMU_012280 [Cryptosporidium muris RN66]|uniref:MMS19 nucleotide excision repair protein n=1 Tax=Cryptosporidium muris (strain RN66) TaxID=441375 RepID=B6AED7_CRYMR|nr:uncharacterized protein CMU_012280 [Cryptosporidium muris RN66]EEA06554.1 hypothetical protein, conserved [Cryptosporidium muris RN66]|eukprot:XP_002140903.1 hypothetical protein [Cryptosporidium muris RN66]